MRACVCVCACMTVSLAETAALKVTVVPREVVMARGEQVTLHCIAHGPTTATVTWQPHRLNFVTSQNGEETPRDENNREV